MKKPSLSLYLELISRCFWAVLAVAGVTGILLLIGRDILGEAVIALLYLLPIGWSTARWGQVPGVCGSIAAALAFDFFFIPPFFTLQVGSLEGWLVLIIFLLVAVAIVGRIQVGLTQAQAREREAIFMYEMSLALARSQTPEEIARTLAEQLQQLYQAALVQVSFQREDPPHSLIAKSSLGKAVNRGPDRVVPIMAARGLVGEICIWGEQAPLPPVENRLLQNFAAQGALAFERVRNNMRLYSKLPVNNE